MANRYPCNYGGDNSKEQPEIQHYETVTRSIHQVPSMTPSEPLQDDNILGAIKAAWFPFIMSILRHSDQIKKCLYNSRYYDNQVDQFVIEQPKQSKPKKYIPKITEEYVSENNDIFKILQNCYTVANNELGFIAVKYNWTERYLRLEQGLNLLANCKNCDCKNYIQGVVCPRGMFRDRNGYCPLDMELYKVKCPTCRQRITPDESFGFGFYDCNFQITYKLVGQKEYKMRQEGRHKVFYFRKLSVSWNLFEYLEAQISICTFV